LLETSLFEREALENPRASLDLPWILKKIWILEYEVPSGKLTYSRH
jgi:hypothetical protein